MKKSTVKIVNKRILIAAVIIIVIAAGFLLLSKQKTVTSEKSVSQNQDDFDKAKDKAVYNGHIPCADCDGIDLKLVLKQNNKYKLTTNYIGKNVAPVVEKGAWSTKTGTSSNSNAVVYVLKAKDDKTTYFLSTEMGLSELDQNMQPVNNPYAMVFRKRK